MIRRRAEERRRLEELRSVGLFAGCTDDELRWLDGLGARIRIPAGTRLMTEGTAARECYLLLEGSAAVSSTGGLVANLGPGSLVGEMALLSRRPRTATVESVTPLSVIVLHHGEFAHLMKLPGVEAKVRRLVSERTICAPTRQASRLQGTVRRFLPPPPDGTVFVARFHQRSRGIPWKESR
ncbi:MAG: cyclic nucleotide-binding domain-containing protein [Actinomycetota bacterium]